MTNEYQLRVLPENAYSEEAIKAYLAKEKGLDIRTINAVRVLKKSIDARQRTIYVNLKVRTYVNEYPQDEQYEHTEYQNVEGRPQVVVVGEGPAGLFAALKLIELGLRPVIIERGKNVHDRKRDMALITKNQKVDPESNYCFGEGGAGAFSDGKLYTRSKKRGNVNKILNVFCQHGAQTSILYEAHPHIGTDKLPRVIENMRDTVIKCGGEVHFETKMTSLLIKGDTVEGVEAVRSTGEQLTIKGPVILATGHSARDVYRYLANAKVEIEPKGIAVGVRLEHPAALIDQIQYHNRNGKGKYLPTAEYSMVTQVDGRGVYSFCMCPGGFVIPAATGPEQIVTNGMSPANRGTKWSNSGMVVEIRPEDVSGEGECKVDGVNDTTATDETANSDLAVMRFQEALERMTWIQGNRRQTAPAQRMADFVNNRLSYDLPKSSYAPGLISSPLHFWMPQFISKRLQEAFKVFGKHHHGFLTNEAVLIASETRTSSPVRVLRNSDNLMHVRVRGLFPCGEGAGYAGGIVSAGIDGERCAEMCAEYLESL
ncbi:NAD-utilizing dehydrogenase [Prevotella lacticifex]|uniref:NAD(P)/FAD-dependent oxidoreductase n=1 Tax=Prevotella lacticifex TaxID=2854755 RepID=UPI001CC67070|nr:FAD-binding protein [Prevotella lacticifex]GJG63871.1 NAD-utilizing dehydrogenase [Prevotella lacticifex]GJG67053.1 NAD-utilizing dehydrogenase [Prevotella lacticifex]